jgi:nucleoside-diphosphate-sugar epimerase
MGEKVLVTGATGFAGRHLVAALRHAGYAVETHSSSASDIGQELPSYSGISHVFHVAGRLFVPDSWRNPGLFYRTNVQGTVNVMEFCREQKASVTLISSYVYGIPQRLPISEDHTVAAVNPYAHTKLLAEDIARFYEKQFDVGVTIVRPFNLYGPNQDRRFLIPQLIHDALDPQVAAMEVADLAPRRDYLHIDDLVRLLILVMTARGSGTYNAGSGKSVSVNELASTIRDLAGVDKPIVAKGAPRQNEIPDVIADISRARDTFGWTPQIELPDGLDGIIQQLQPTIADAR